MTRTKMPAERPSLTKKFHVGEVEGYLTVGLREDGTPGEMFLTVQKAGSVERGLCHALALMVSVALQHGVPLKKVVGKLKGLHFEPAGATGDKSIPFCTSFIDYCARYIEEKWLKEKV